MSRRRLATCIACALLLACASAPLLARSSRDDLAASAGNGTCPQEEVSAIVVDGSDPAQHAATPPARSKYAKPATPASRGQAAGGGEGDGGSLPRARNPKWHSFLPGMFR
ncbi:MAG: hypothetical protein QM761_01625 [Pseudoxanthomonas sp.]